MNKFVEKTMEALWCYGEKRIAPKGFFVGDDKAEDCVLIIGLNPAGDENDAMREQTDKTYLYFIDDTRLRSDRVHNGYFGAIYNLVTSTIGQAKWPWCNKEWKTLEEEFDNSDDLSNDDKGLIKAFYDSHKDDSCTIYIGDMFYYHQTSSKKLPLKKNGYDLSDYCEKMLKMHIDELKESNKTIRYIYINNAKVSHYISKNETYKEMNGVKVFFGGMLSGMRAMDIFSRERLVSEIKEKTRIIDEATKTAKRGKDVF